MLVTLVVLDGRASRFECFCGSLFFSNVSYFHYLKPKKKLLIKQKHQHFHNGCNDVLVTVLVFDGRTSRFESYCGSLFFLNVSNFHYLKRKKKLLIKEKHHYLHNGYNDVLVTLVVLVVLDGRISRFESYSGN